MHLSSHFHSTFGKLKKTLFWDKQRTARAHALVAVTHPWSFVIPQYPPTTHSANPLQWITVHDTARHCSTPFSVSHISFTFYLSIICRSLYEKGSWFWLFTYFSPRNIWFWQIKWEIKKFICAVQFLYKELQIWIVLVKTLGLSFVELNTLLWTFPLMLNRFLRF